MKGMVLVRVWRKKCSHCSDGWHLGDNVFPSKLCYTCEGKGFQIIYLTPEEEEEYFKREKRIEEAMASNHPAIPGAYNSGR
jgi:hypothetical protein